MHFPIVKPVDWVSITNKIGDVKFLCLFVVPIRDLIYNHIS